MSKELTPQRLIPTGECWYGCGGEAERGSFFFPGHDRVAVFAVLLIECGGVLEFLTRHGYAPGGKNSRKVLERWRNRSKAQYSEVKKKSKTADGRETDGYTRQ